MYCQLRISKKAFSTPKNYVKTQDTLLIQRTLNRQLELNLWTIGAKTGFIHGTYCLTLGHGFDVKLTILLELYEGRLKLTINKFYPKITEIRIEYNIAGTVFEIQKKMVRKLMSRLQWALKQVSLCENRFTIDLIIINSY